MESAAALVTHARSASTTIAMIVERASRAKRHATMHDTHSRVIRDGALDRTARRIRAPLCSVRQWR
jgi:hypothetical protein